jgi:hypothetical protein
LESTCELRVSRDGILIHKQPSIYKPTPVFPCTISGTLFETDFFFVVTSFCSGFPCAFHNFTDRLYDRLAVHKSASSIYEAIPTFEEGG